MLPLSLTIPIPASPGAVAIAAMVSSNIKMLLPYILHLYLYNKMKCLAYRRIYYVLSQLYIILLFSFKWDKKKLTQYFYWVLYYLSAITTFL
jgi:hypothetical protein